MGYKMANLSASLEFKLHVFNTEKIWAKADRRLTAVWPDSDPILTQVLTRFWPDSDPILTKVLTEFWPDSDPILIRFWQ